MKKPAVDSYDYILSVLDKAETGPIVEERTWDKEYITKKTRELIKKYDITFNKGIMISDDDALADRLFEASMEMALDSGVYCINTKRRMIWERDELQGAIDRAPSELKVGYGDGAHTIKRRDPEANGNVTILGGAYGTPVREENFRQMVTAYAKEPLVDIVETPSLATAWGRHIRIDSPWEAIAAKREAELVLEAIKLAGRPEGTCVASGGTSGTDIIELAATSYDMFRQTDWHHSSFVAENKVSYADLTRAVHYANTGSISHTFCDPIYGGYLGGTDGVSIGCASGYILLRATLFGDTMNAGPAHTTVAADTHPDLLPAQALAIQAISRNTPMFTSAHIRPSAGPCTKQVLYEVAALCMTAVSSGASFLKTIQTTTGRHMGHTTPVEVRFCAQVAHATEGMSRKDANEIVCKLVSKYEGKQLPQNVGKPFHEAYNLDTLEPTAEWQGIYEVVCEEFKKEFNMVL
ncbi:monomethylamine:corrinoid methyltransferase [bacterium]|jgi:methylamine---corrinoid protein Co-methyltransferase|nr:monomethylamine:corrinoid methyltransferase [bacterium]